MKGIDRREISLNGIFSLFYVINSNKKKSTICNKTLRHREDEPSVLLAAPTVKHLKQLPCSNHQIRRVPCL